MMGRQDPKILVGVDIVEIARIKMVVERTPRFLTRVFTPQELDYCSRKKDPYPSLAVRFAAREAVRKLDPAFIKGVGFQDTEVILDKNGRPQIVLHGAALERAQKAGVSQISVSLSHSKEQAIAMVVANKG